jgi:hypothetical protein
MGKNGCYFKKIAEGESLKGLVWKSAFHVEGTEQS